jgi:hypothetical protein
MTEQNIHISKSAWRLVFSSSYYLEIKLSSQRPLKSRDFSCDVYVVREFCAHTQTQVCICVLPFLVCFVSKLIALNESII